MAQVLQGALTEPMRGHVAEQGWNREHRQIDQGAESRAGDLTGEGHQNGTGGGQED